MKAIDKIKNTVRNEKVQEVAKEVVKAVAITVTIVVLANVAQATVNRTNNTIVNATGFGTLRPTSRRIDENGDLAVSYRGW